MMNKFSLIAYAIWLFVGWFGLHHFYLGRDRQGVLWLTSFGGLFGLGWLRDFWRIPLYVRDANEESGYMELLGAEIKYYGKPSIWLNLHRIVGQVMFGYFYRGLVYYCIPEEMAGPGLVLLVIPIGTAFGTYMVSNVGRMQSSFLYSLIGAYTGELLFGEPHLLYVEMSTPSIAVGVSMLFSTLGWQYRRHKEQHSCCKRMFVWAVLFTVFCGLLTSGIYFNGTVETENGETIKVREALNNFLKSPHWHQMKRSSWKVYEDYKEEGWEGVQRRLVILADVEGEERALSVLGLEKGVGGKEVKERYHELAKEWHPDHHQGETKVYAQERFMEIKEAYNTLNAIYGKRQA